MKFCRMVLLSLCSCTLAFAQQETLVGNNIESGGFGGPVVKITSLRGKTAVLVGGRGGWIINHTFIIGGGGYGLVSDIDAAVAGPSGEPFLNFGYGGVELEYIHEWDRLVHLSFGLLVGGGSVGCRHGNGSNTGEEKSFFTMEPWVNGNLNVTDFFQISAGVSYRWVTGSHTPYASDVELSGVTGILLLRFGSF